MPGLGQARIGRPALDQLPAGQYRHAGAPLHHDAKDEDADEIRETYLA